MIECLGVLTAMVALLGLAFAKRVLLGAGNGKSEIVGAAELKMLEEVSRPSQYREWEDQFREASVEAAHRLAGTEPADAWKVWKCYCNDCGKSKREHAKVAEREARATHVARWVARHFDCDVEVDLDTFGSWTGDIVYTHTHVSCSEHDAEEVFTPAEARAYDEEIGEWEHRSNSKRRGTLTEWVAGMHRIAENESDYSVSYSREACGRGICVKASGHTGPCVT